ncbi:MAG: translation initiation factor IF-2 [Candidatus Zixiibacteriota bacterium]|nr:MAG: translation initiation factor IF-2 [candidate division Zixibacteria bacterium]
MTKKRIYELAKEYKLSSNAMLAILRELKFEPKSHMSVATDEMITAIKNKFTEQKQAAKKEMEHQEQIKAAVRKKTNIGSVQISDGKSKIAGIVRKIEKKQRQKDRRKKKARKAVDKVEVAKSFKSTMAGLSGVKGKKRYRRSPQSQHAEAIEDSNVIEVNEFISVAELAKLLDIKPAEIITKLFQMGMMATINQRLDMDTIEMVSSEYGFEIAKVAEVGEYAKELEHEEKLVKRAPVVTVMGHVDHGKTSLLDYIRKTSVVAGEAGAITQHIGAYEVEYNSDRIAFLDTPGHEAFTAMRARGTQITDIVVLVVAADDGVRPQTIEAIDHAKAANVPIIVAINKVDKPNANSDNVRTQLSKLNLVAEEWGGKTIMVEVSAKAGTGIDKLLEMILLQAEVMDLQADPTIRAQGVVVDSKLEKGLGPVVTVMIQKGSCAVGDSIVAGTYCGRIRTITNDREEKIRSIGPSTPARITGLNGVPQAGDSFITVKNDQEAKEIGLKRSQIKREQEARRTLGRMSLDRVFDRIKEGQIKELRLIIKADVDGSVEVLTDTLGKIATEEVKTNIIHSAVGAVSESDVLLATASDAVIIGFNITVDSRARDLSKQEKVDIRLYNVIYEAENDIKRALEGMLSPEVSEKFVGMAEVRDIFKIPKVGVIAGCYVKEGRFNRKDKVRLSRDGKIIFDGNIISLKRFKEDAREVKEGFECGIGLENFNDIKVGDIIEAFELIETARTLS